MAMFYPGTKHASFDDPAAEEVRRHGGGRLDSWQRVLAFFDEHVKDRSANT